MNTLHDWTFGGAHRTEASCLLDGFPFFGTYPKLCLLQRIFLENYNRIARARAALTYVLRRCHDTTRGVMLFKEKKSPAGR